MAYPVATRASGDLITAAIWNADIRDNLNDTLTSVTYASGNFTASGSMTWTVSSSDQNVLKYHIRNKRMLVVFDIRTADVGGTASTDLRIKIPNSQSAATTGIQNACRIQNAGTYAAGYVYTTTADPTNLQLRRIDDSNWTTGTGNNAVGGQIEFEII